MRYGKAGCGLLVVVMALVVGCPAPPDDPMQDGDGAEPDVVDYPGDGPVAAEIMAPLGEPLPSASLVQLATFKLGKDVAMKRFDLAEGLGPSFNVVSCTGCHERPVIGGSAGLYRNFFISATEFDDGSFFLGDVGGIVRVFHYGSGVARPFIPSQKNVFAQRNPIPMFGVGLLAELAPEEILAREDPDDMDGDGISGRANYEEGVLGRFGRKAQTASLEGFIRGPLFNHLGVTTVPLTDAQRAQLPVDLILAETGNPVAKLIRFLQAAAPDGPNFDNDAAGDPEMSPEELFDLVSFTMLLAAPELNPLTTASEHGRQLFHEANCSACHVPRLEGPRGPIHAYSDLLLHDMGEELADGIKQGDATGSEFRTQPLWGLAAVGPYLHDGRAKTIAEAILAHGGEAEASRESYAGLSSMDQQDVVAFLLTLGGASEASTGLIPPEEPIAVEGTYGGPRRALSEDEAARFLSGRELMDHDFGHAGGVGAMAGEDGGPRFNGDSCRACHQDPVFGGAGPRDVNVMRHGFVDLNGIFSPPLTTPNTILHKEIRSGFSPVEAENGINVFEHRQTPHMFGLGLVDAISDETILANADPEDTDGDGISGRAHVLSDGRIGRFGWKADVPSLAEFVRDAMGAEIGITLPEQAGLTFGLTSDDDGVADPELSLEEAEDLLFFLNMLAGPPRQASATSDEALTGAMVFNGIGCAACHVSSLPAVVDGATVDVPLFSDLLLHEILPEGSRGIDDGFATMREFRTAPLWGLSESAPYFHSGEADTIDEAIRLHDGEAAATRDAYLLLSAEDQAALLAFLGSL